MRERYPVPVPRCCCFCFCFFLLLFFVCRPPISFSAGKTSEVCISLGGRFPPFSSEGKPPQKVAKGPRDLALCRVFREKTCCDVAQTYPALLSVRKLASAGEASQECLDLWEVLECSICNPLVGTQPGPPVICASFCDMVFQSCSDAYFSIDVKTQVLSPCGLNDVICGRASEWVSNGTDLCQLAGFSVQPVRFMHHDAEEPFCYGKRATLESVAELWRGSKHGSVQNAESLRVLGDFQQWVREMTLRERAYWAVGGMFLSVCLLFVCKRKSHSHRQKQAAIRRTARMLRSRNPLASGNNYGESIQGPAVPFGWILKFIVLVSKLFSTTGCYTHGMSAAY